MRNIIRRPARLDADRTATGKTRIVHHPSVGERIVSGGPLVRPEYEAEDGTRVPLTEVRIESPDTFVYNLPLRPELCGAAREAAAVAARDRQIAALCEQMAAEIDADETWSPGDMKAGEMAAYRRIAALLGGAK